MKYISLLLSSICVFIIVLVNLYYNSITLDMQRMKEYIIESNNIFYDIVENEEITSSKSEEYISKLVNLKKGIENAKTSFLVKDYKNYKVKYIENLIYSISEYKDNKVYLEEVEKYNKLSEEELNKLINENIMKGTYLWAKSYI